MKPRRKTNPIQIKLFEEMQAIEVSTVLELMTGQNLELETAIAELLLSAIDKGNPRKGDKHDA